MNNPFLKNFLMAAISLVSYELSAEDFYRETRKNIKVSSSVLLDLETNYADINIQTWDQYQMEIVVKLNVTANTEERADEIFKSIQVNISESEAEVGLDVSLRNYSCGNNKGENYTVVVDVKMPVGGSTNGHVAFGNVNIGEIKGRCDLRIEYGDLKANALMSGNNDVTIAFGSAKINMSSGGKFRNEYGDIKIKKLTGSAEFRSAFGDLELSQVTKEVKLLQVKIEYGDARIDLAADASFNFDAECSYGQLDLPNNAKKSTHTSDYMISRTAGTIGSGGNNRLKIDCDFGDVEIETLANR